MSLETKLEALTAAIGELVKVMAAARVDIGPSTRTAPPLPPVAAPVAPAAPAPAPLMPPPPVFTAPPAPVPPLVGSGAPFGDPKGLIDYVMSAYRDMGPTKGAQIQQVLTSLGYANINDVKPEHYGTLYANVEMLRRS